MLDILFLSFLFILLELAIVILFFLFLKLSSLSLTGAPYIQIPEDVLPSIVKTLDIRGDSIVYDLGCGDGRVLIACQQQVPEAEYIGIDNALLPVLIARREVEKRGLNNLIKIVKEDLFKTNLSDATHIFIYLYPKMVNALLSKCQEELKKGTRVVTCDYRFEKKEPVEVIDLHRPAGKLGKFLYVYEF